MKILDVGCGTKKIPSSIGLDIKPTGTVQGSGYNLPFKDESFDIVVSKEFLEHVDIDPALREQIRVLKTGGRLVIEQANLLDPLYLLWVMRRPKKAWYWIRNKDKPVIKQGCVWKCEDIHSRLWWRRKLKKYPLKVIESTSDMGMVRGGIFKLLVPVIGNILITAIKEEQ